MTVFVLEDAAEDMESGRRFYESLEPGIGAYFLESILSDLRRWLSTRGFTRSILVSIGCSRSGFHLPSTMRSKARRLRFMQFWTCAGTRCGSAKSWGDASNKPFRPDPWLYVRLFLHAIESTDA